MYKSFFKRLFDILFSLILILLLSPVLIGTYIAICITMGNPIFFKQERVGKNLCLFTVKKFRTMREKKFQNESDSIRLTKLGAFLRKYSLDEFPQFFNILMGDMSFIGPRPLLKKYIPYYNEREIKRHEVKPGMTSLAGINGRSYLTWDEQFELDVQYVENLSFMLDLNIFLRTFPKVMGSKDMMVVGRKDMDSFDVYRKKSDPENLKA